MRMLDNGDGDDVVDKTAWCTDHGHGLTQKRSSFSVFEKSRSAHRILTHFCRCFFSSFSFLPSVNGRDKKKHVHADNNVRVVFPRGILQSNVTDSGMPASN